MNTDGVTSACGVGVPAEAGAPAVRGDAGCAPDDAALIERARGGDQQAFALLYLRYVSVVHGVVLARVGPAGRGEAEDITQDVFVRAWGGLGELRNGAAAAAWLVSIARRRASDWTRASGRRRGREVCREAQRVREGTGAVVRDVRDGRTETVLGLVDGLPKKYREVLVLRFVAGMTGPQIGLCLGMTPGAVRVCLHRGMERLRAGMSECER